MKKKYGFTLIELLAVIIILGILLLIAVPAVMKYILGSKKATYINSAKSIIAGARTLANSETLNMRDEDVTYYLPVKYIKTENGGKSPYGEFTEAYVGVIYDKEGYRYYWISNDTTGQGIENVTSYDLLDEDDVVGNLNDNMIRSTVEKTGIGNRSKIYIFDMESNSWQEETALESISEKGTPIVCKKAKTLHTTECRTTSSGCYDSGYVEGNKGTTITYGTIPDGAPKAGNAYDCKVSTTSGYTERFYYVASDGDNSVLIYYNNVDGQTPYKYDNVDENWHGPREGANHLPSVNEWDNPRLIAPETRQILTQSRTTVTTGGTIEPFTYRGVSSRFLDVFDVMKACGKQPISHGYFDKCNYFMENIGQYETDSGLVGYWLETPHHNTYYIIWIIYGNERRIVTGNASNPVSVGVRPVITIKTSFIEQ